MMDWAGILCGLLLLWGGVSQLRIERESRKRKRESDPAGVFLTDEEIDVLIEKANAGSGYFALIKQSECHRFARLVAAATLAKKPPQS